MKKVLIFLMILLAITASAFAKEKTDQTEKPKLTEAEKRLVAEIFVAIKESKLDLKRWEFVTASSNNDYFFIDKETIATPYSDILEVWECHFRQAGKGSCGFGVCKEKKIDTTKHFHYTRYKYDLSRLKQTITAMTTKDEAGNIVFSFDVPSYYQKESEVFPESLGEKEMIEAKKIIQNRNKNKRKK